MPTTALYRSLLKRASILQVVPVLCFALIASACRDAQEPQERFGPEIQAAVISASANSHFSLRPPLGAPAPQGSELDAVLLPFLSIVICEWNGSVCVRTIATIPSGGTGIAIVGKDFKASWQAKAGVVRAGATYRMSFLAATTEVGSALFRVESNANDLKLVGAGVIGVVMNSTLPITFGIDKGAVTVITAAGGSVTMAGIPATLKVPAGAVSAPTGVTIDAFQVGACPATPPGLPVLAAVTVGPAATSFSPAATLAMTYDPAAVLPGATPADLAIYAIGEDCIWTELAGTVDLAAHTVTSPIAHLGNYVVAPVVVTRAVVHITATPAPASVGDTIDIAATAFSAIATRPVHAATFAFSADTSRARITSATATTARVALLKPGAVEVRATATGLYVAAGGVSATASVTPLQYAYSLVAAPSHTAVAVLGGAAQASVAVLDRLGNVIAGHPFTVTSANVAIASATATTSGIDILGGTTAGNTDLTVHAVTPGHDSVHVVVTVEAQRITAALSATPVTTPYGTAPVLTAKLLPAVQGRTVSFAIEGETAGVSAITDNTGIATANWPSTNIRPGTHTVNATITGDIALVDAHASAALIVQKAIASLSLAFAPSPVLSGDPITARVAFTGPEGLPRNASVTLSAPVSQTVTTDADGIAVVTMAAILPVASYAVTASFAGNSDFDARSAGASFDVMLRPLSLTASPASGAYNGSATLSAMTTPALTGKVATFRLVATGATIGTATTDAAGTATLTLPIGLPAGDHAYEVMVASDGVHAAAQAQATITVARAAATIDAAAATAVYNATVNLGAQVTPARAGTRVDFSIDGVSAGQATADASGAVSLSYHVTANVGSHAIVATVAQDDYLAAASASAQLTVERASAHLASSDLTAPYGTQANLTAAYSPARSGIDVEFSVDGVVVGSAATDASGTAALSFTATLPAGTHALAARTTEDCCYVATTAQSTLTMTRVTATLAADPTDVAYGTAPVLTARMLPALAGRMIRFSIAGESGFINATTDAQGTARGTWSGTQITPGTHAISAALAGDAFFDDVTTSAVLTVARVTPHITLSFGSSTVQFGATLELRIAFAGSTELGLARSVTIGGVAPMTLVTNASGDATATWPVSALAGSHTLTAAFAGDATYESAQTTASFSVTSVPSTIRGETLSVTYPLSSVTLQAQVTPAVSGRVVAFAFNGSAAGTGVTDAAGRAVHDVALTVAPGDYSYTVNVADNGFYGGAAGGGSVTFKRGGQQLVAENITVAYGASTTLAATLAPARSGVTVEFEVDGAAAGSGVTNAAGVAARAYIAALTPGTHTVVARIAQDAFYDAATVATTLSTTRISLALAIDPVTTDYGIAPSLTARTTPARAGISVMFAIVGQTGSVAAVTDAGGIAMATWSSALLAPGSHATTASISTDPVVENVSATGAVVVRKAVPHLTLSYDPQTVQYGGTLGIRVQFDGAATLGFNRTITIDGTPVTITTASNGVGTGSMQVLLDAGPHSLTARFAGDVAYDPAESSATFTVTTAPSALTGSDIVATYPAADASLRATVTPGVAGRLVQFVVAEGPTGTAITDAAGVATFNAAIAGVAAGTHAYAVTIAADGHNGAATGGGTLRIDRAQPVMSLPTMTGTFGTNVELAASVTPARAGITVAFSVDGTDAGTSTTDAQGVARRTHTITAQSGTRAVIARIANDPWLLDGEVQGILNVDAAVSSLTFGTINSAVPGTTVAVRATLSPLLAGTKIQFVMGTTTLVGMTDTHGIAEVGFTAPLAEGTYNIHAKFFGTQTQTAAEADAALIVARATLAFRPLASSFSAYPGTSSIGAAFTTPVGGKLVSIFMADSLLGTVTSGPDGTAKLLFLPTQLPGTYTIRAEFAGDVTHAPASMTGTVVIAPAAATIKGTDVLNALAYQPTALHATMVGAWVTGVQVTFTLGDSSVTAMTNASGIADAVLPAPGVVGTGTYTVTVSDNRFVHAVATPVLNVVRGASSVVSETVTPGVWSVATQFVARVMPAAPNRTVFFYIEEVLQGSALTDANGRATLAYMPAKPPGDYPMRITVNPDANYLTATLNMSYPIAPTTITFSMAGGTVPVGTGLFMIAQTSPPLNGATVSFNLDNVNKGNVLTDFQGRAFFNFPANLDAGAHVVRVLTSSTQYYNGSFFDATVNVVKTATSMTLSDLTVAVGSSIRIAATLQPALPFVPVTIRIGTGAPIVVTTEATGAIVFQTTNNLAADATYPMTIQYLGDEQYLASQASATLTVPVSQPVIVVTKDIVGAYGQGADIPIVGAPNGGIVNFNVNGVITPVTINNGNLHFQPTPALDAGTHTFTATFDARPGYLSAASSGKFIVNQVVPILLFQPQTVTTVHFNFHAVTAPGLQVDFYRVVNGSPVFVDRAIADQLGVAEVLASGSWPVGSYEVIATTRSTSNYGARSATTTYTVDFVPTSLTVLPVTSTFGTPIPLVAQFGDSVAGRTVTFTNYLGNTLGTALSNATGKATIFGNAQEGGVVRSYTATFAGDATFSGSTATASWTMLKAPAQLNVIAPATIIAGKTFNITVLLGGPNNGIPITIRDANGVAIGGNILVSGAANIQLVANWGLGAHTFTASFPGSSSTLPGTKEFTITVTQN
jgi:hypothetical protein